MAANWRFPLLRRTLLPSSPTPPPAPCSYPIPAIQPQFKRKFFHLASLSMGECTSSSSTPTLIQERVGTSRWKPTCLYYTQGRCTKMDDPMHVERFNHSCSVELGAGVAGASKFRAQEYDYFLVLDLEGKVEILEFPVLLFDSKTMDVLDVFHRFVRPTKMSEQRINEYIEGKYGKFGVDRVWHDTAIKFEEVIPQFEGWLDKHNLWRKEQDRDLSNAAFVTCGNWDLKTKIPQQCEVSQLKLPPYFMQWINLKDIYLNFYNRRAPGMLSMMRQLQIQAVGSHHLGIDDSKNIARVLQRMLADGSLLQITARRLPDSPDKVQFRFQNRI